MSQTKKLSIKDNNLRDTDNSKDYPTLDDLIKMQKDANYPKTSVHRRRDLDSLG